jgi:DNA-binding transcriptional regulator YbjK
MRAMSETPDATKPAKVVRKRQKRGEESRRKILEAALALIGRDGLQALTHRTIAAEAGVPLSMTTYFFTSLADLIEQAFDHFQVVMSEGDEHILSQLRGVLDAIPADALQRDAATRQAVVSAMTREICALIRRGTATDTSNLAVELNFLTLFKLEPGVRAKVLAYRESLVQSIAMLTRRIGSSSPDIDASLVLTIYHRIQFEGLHRAHPWPPGWPEAEIERMLLLLFRLA